MNDKKQYMIIKGKNDNSTASQVWSITKFLSSFLWCSTKFVFKNTPTALGMAWEVKKEISNAIAEEIQEAKKQQKQIALEEKIMQLQPPKKSQSDQLDIDEIIKISKDKQDEHKK